MTIASAAGKVILLGEHAVVYGQPAVAAPVSEVRAWAEVTTTFSEKGIFIHAEDLGRSFRLDDPPDELTRPLQETVRNTLRNLRFPLEALSLEIHLRSRIPIARGMGSGAAVATAIVRAIGKYLSRDMAPAHISALVFQIETLLHGTPSGIDNTVIAFERPLWYRRGEVAFLTLNEPIHLVIGDTGTPSRTRDMVAHVREKYSAAPAAIEAIFDEIARCTEAGREALEQGNPITLGGLLSENHALLQRLGVSSEELDALVMAARHAGALGAKMTGGGGGGCMVALAFEEDVPAISEALMAAGAKQVFYTMVA